MLNGKKSNDVKYFFEYLELQVLLFYNEKGMIKED